MSKNKWHFDLTMEKTKKFNKQSPVKTFTKEELELINDGIKDGKSITEAIETTSKIS